MNAPIDRHRFDGARARLCELGRTNRLIDKYINISTLAACRAV
jgi:hypothetical protein